MRSSRDDFYPSFKICILGSETVGKTALLNRYITGFFQTDYKPTIAAAFVSSQEIVESQVIILNIWDTAGQEKYQSMMPLYLRNVDLIILVLDITNSDSMKFIIKWYENEYNSIIPKPLIFICLNKIDLEPTFNISLFIDWCKEKNLNYFKISALTGLNIQLLFKEIAKDLINENKIKKNINNNQIKLNSNIKKCC